MVYTTDGKNNVIEYLNGDGPTPPSHIAFGTGDDDANESDSALVSESIRIAVDSSTKANKRVTFVGTLSTLQANSTSLYEVGLFNAASSGTMFSRSVFSGLDKDNTIQVKASITVRII